MAKTIPNLIRGRSDEWERLCEALLPLNTKSSIWRYSRVWSRDEPDQGWKIHVSASVSNAVEILARVGPLLRARNMLFKAPASLDEVMKLNSGIWYGYPQIGKVVTVYPRGDAEFKRLAEELHLATAPHTGVPDVPFDFRYRRGGCIFYRYGEFRRVGAAASGERAAGPNGKRSGRFGFIDDRRDPDNLPIGVQDPIGGTPRPRPSKRRSRLGTRYHVFESLSQRGKGGVYAAVDSGAKRPVLRLIKEGRRHGETGWDGTDGYEMLRRETEVTGELAKRGVPVPAIIDQFRAGGNRYLVLEWIDGVTLDKLARAGPPGLPLSDVLYLCGQLSRILERIHDSGWVWRDCKLANVILKANGELFAVDFEGSRRSGETCGYAWSTPDFAAPEIRPGQVRIGGSRVSPNEDLYSLGLAFVGLISGGRFGPSDDPGRGLREFSVPPSVTNIIRSLLDPDPEKRPAARGVASQFSDIAAASFRKPSCPRSGSKSGSALIDTRAGCRSR